MDFNQTSDKHINFGNTLNEFMFYPAVVNVKVTVTIYRDTLVIALAT